MIDIATFLLARIREDASSAWQTPGRSCAQRILIECETKRRLLALHQPERFTRPPVQYFCRHDQRIAGVWPCLTVRLLALPYFGHPDYQQEWAVHHVTDQLRIDCTMRTYQHPVG